jgi:lysyl-tRNA synthetase class 2
MSRIDEAIQAKKEKRRQLEERGIVVHPYSYDKRQTVSQAREMEGQTVQTAGRVMGYRTHGGVLFLDLVDSTSSIQVMIRQGEVADETWEWLSLVDRSDFLGVSGEVTQSRTGELTILAKEATFLGKALRPLPTEFNAAEDKEVRFRRRYVDMLINPDTRRVLDARWTILREVRRFLTDKHNFVEVETPVLQPLYGGTNATPFTTHMKALDTSFYLRIAPELYLKRLIVGGYDRVFEIARNFRNEGIDQTHQPEFTMIEWYETYADYHRMMDVAEELLKHLTQVLYGHTRIMVGDTEVDIGVDWPRITMQEALQREAGIDLENLDDEAVFQLLHQNNIQMKGDFTRGKALFELFDNLAAPKLIEPTWIIDYPRDISPLSKAHRENPKMAERFEGYIGGKEICDGWSEITDPLDQRAVFENEQRNMRAGDTEAHPLDEDFLEAMEHGMPPLGGIGMGIDRLVMFLTNTWSIREVIAFPTLRPVGGAREGEGLDAGGSMAEEHGQAAVIEEGAHEDNLAAEIGGEDSVLPPREQAEALLNEYIENDNLRRHCRMVAAAMAAYARALGEDEELWYQTGLLHDLDWEKYPDEHPNKAIREILANYPQELRLAIAAHAPERSGRQPQTLLERYLYACDELSGFINAIALMRPDGFEGMSYKSVKKKMKDKAFAANVSREDIVRGFELIGRDPAEHVEFLAGVFAQMRE